MVYTTYKNGNGLGMVNMAWFNHISPISRGDTNLDKYEKYH